MKPFAIMLILAGTAVAAQPGPVGVLEAPLPLETAPPLPCQSCATPLVHRPSWLCGHIDPSPYFALWEGYCQEPWHQHHYDLTPPAPTSGHHCAVHGHAAAPWMAPCSGCASHHRPSLHIGKHLTHLLGHKKTCACTTCVGTKRSCTECSSPDQAIQLPPAPVDGEQPPADATTPKELETLPLDVE